MGVLMETNLSLFCLSSLGGGGRVSDPICTMSRYLPFLGFEGSPYQIDHVTLTCGDEALLVLVVNTERLLQLLLESLVILLHQELGGQLTKLSKLEKTRP